MKKLSFLFLLSFMIQISNAQVINALSYDTTTFQGKADHYLQYLDKNQIPTHILYDRVFPFARLDVFNQGTSDTSSCGQFMQVISELYNSNYNGTSVFFKKITCFKVFEFKNLLYLRRPLKKHVKFYVDN